MIEENIGKIKMLKIGVILVAYSIFIFIIATKHIKNRNAKLKGFIIAIVIFFFFEFAYLLGPIIKSWTSNGMSFSEINFEDFVSIVIAFFELAFTIFIEYRNNKLNKEKFRFLNFDEFEIKDPSFTQKKLDNAKIILISNQNPLPTIYEIIPNRLDIYVILIKKIFKSEDLFEHYVSEDNKRYIRKVTISNIDTVKIEREGNTTKYIIDFQNNIENSEALNDILLSNSNDFADKKMLKIKFKYRTVDRIFHPIKRPMKLYIEKYNHFDEVSNAFNMVSCDNNCFLFCKERH